MYQNRHNNSPGFNNQDQRKYKHYETSPFTFEFKGVAIKVDADGKAIVTQEHEDGTFDEIVTTVAFFNRVVRVLQTTRKVVIKNEPYQEQEEDM